MESCMIYFYTVYSSPGSIITKTQLVFNSSETLPSVEEISNTLLTEVETGHVDPLHIIPSSVSVNGSGKFDYISCKCEMSQNLCLALLLHRSCRIGALVYTDIIHKTVEWNEMKQRRP